MNILLLQRSSTISAHIFIWCVLFTAHVVEDFPAFIISMDSAYNMCAI